jgi:isoquinoline 1-oxidoreductase beta subunit
VLPKRRLVEQALRYRRVGCLHAQELVKVDWTPGDSPQVSEQDILDHGAKPIAAPQGGALLVDGPGIDAAFRAAKSKLERTYTTANVLHAQLEPVNALAFEKDGRFEIHTGNQNQSLTLSMLARYISPIRPASVLQALALQRIASRKLLNAAALRRRQPTQLRGDGGWRCNRLVLPGA